MTLEPRTADWLALWLVPGIGPKRIAALLDALGRIEDILSASHSALTQAGLSSELAQAVMEARESMELKAELTRIEDQGITLVDWESPDYPRLLTQIADAPPLLYLKGQTRFNGPLHLAFVGSRKASWQGKSLTERLVKRLAQLHPEIVIVSGLALGIDGAAHKAALEAGLQTIAVLGSGLGEISPPSHKSLAQEVAAHGALVSEFPMTTGPQAQNFPLRNRIISGISQGVLVVEAGQRSGASITANLALEQGREVFALPGAPDSPFSYGTNRMIQQGRAKLVIEAEDMLVELLPDFLAGLPPVFDPQQKAQKQPDLDPEELALLTVLESGPLHQDQIAQGLQKPVHLVLALLTALELKGVIVNRSGSLYELNHPRLNRP